jgi:hypothetical protein
MEASRHDLIPVTIPASVWVTVENQQKPRWGVVVGVCNCNLRNARFQRYLPHRLHHPNYPSCLPYLRISEQPRIARNSHRLERVNRMWIYRLLWLMRLAVQPADWWQWRMCSFNRTPDASWCPSHHLGQAGTEPMTPCHVSLELYI